MVHFWSKSSTLWIIDSLRWLQLTIFSKDRVCHCKRHPTTIVPTTVAEYIIANGILKLLYLSTSWFIATICEHLALHLRLDQLFRWMTLHNLSMPCFIWWGHIVKDLGLSARRTLAWNHLEFVFRMNWRIINFCPIVMLHFVSDLLLDRSHHWTPCFQWLFLTKFSLFTLDQIGMWAVVGHVCLVWVIILLTFLSDWSITNFAYINCCCTLLFAFTNA